MKPTSLPAARLVFPALAFAVALSAQTPAAAPAVAPPAPSSAAVPPPTAPKVEFPAMSPVSTVKQRVGLTDFELTYARPGMKGREVFGAFIPYGEVWRTGANNATKLTFNQPVKFNGTEVAPGTYELFTIPGADEWTFIVHKNMSQWGAYKYDAKNDVARVTVKPVKLPNAVETLSIGFADLRDQTATLYLAWENTRVPVKIEVNTAAIIVPQIEAALKFEGKRSGQFYYNAASYFFENGLDAKRAGEFAAESVKLSPKAPYMMLLKARIHAKLGEKEDAIASAEKAAALGVTAEGPNSGIALQARKLAASLK